MCIIITIALGLLSRADFLNSPQFIIFYVGDCLWALMVYWGICLLKPYWPYKFQFLAAILFCYTIELSQLYQAHWLNEIRHTTLGALILGFGFKASDIVFYTVGVLLGVILNHTMLARLRTI